MNNRFSRLIAASVFAGGLAVSQSHAVSFDFTSSTEYTENFKNTFLTTGSGNSLTTTGGAIVHSSSGSGTNISAYDTTPDTTVTNTFTNVTVEFDFSTTISNVSFGVLFGGDTRANANLAVFNINNSGSQDQLRILTGRDWNLATGVNGSVTSPADNQTLATGGWTTGKTYHASLTVTYTNATTASILYTISDPYTVSGALTSFSASAAGVTVASSGEIALRTGFSGSGGTLNIDNVQIYTSAIPEPSACALLGGACAVGLVLIQRRRRC